MEDEDPLECPLHVGDLVRVSDEGKAFSKRLKDRDAGLGRVRKVSDDGLVIDVEWVLGGRWIGLRRRDLVRRTAVQEGYTEQRKRQRPTTLLQDTFTVPSSTAAAAVAATPIASAVAVVPSPPSTTKRTPANKKTGTPKTGKVTPKRTSSSSSSKSTAAKRKRATTTTTTTKKKVAASGEPTSSNGGCTNGATIRVTTGAPAHHHSPDGDNGGVADGPVGCAPPPPHHELYERHKREFERVVARLEKVDKFGFFLDQAPPEYEENYDQPPSRPLSLSLLSQPPHTQQQSTTTTTTAEGGGASEATSSSVGLAVPSTVAAPGGVPLVVAGDSTSTGVMASTVAVDADEEQPKPAKRRRKVGGVGGGLDFSGSGATIFPSHAPFNWAMIRRRMEKGRYVWRRESARPRRIGMKRKAWPLLHRLGVHWPLFLSDVNAMCDAALERDDEDNDENDAEGDAAAAVKDGEHRMTVTAVDTVRSPARIEKGSLLYAVRQVKEAVRLAYERTGCRQMAELSAADDRHKFATAVQSHTNTEAAMQTWRQTPFPERKYERLETGDAVCAGLSPVDERIAAYELRTHLPESFVGLSYRYDDTGQSEAWMKSVVDETGGNGATATSPRARGEGLKDAGTGAAATAASTEDEAREAALALAADNGVIRAQVAASMSSLLIAVQDKVMTETGVLKQPELKSANWCSDRENHPTDAKPEVVEKPVWGIDCYTRRNILVCLETDFDAAVALQFVEKWLLPAINACPDHLASDVANAARLLEDVPFEEEPTIGGEASVGAEPTPTSHTLLRAALAEKIRKSAPRWLKGAANQLRRAREALGADFFRVHPKGHGSILLCPSVKANSMVTFYRGELYPSWRWGEKMDAIDITQQRKDLKPALPDFYNMMLERPQSDPRGYGLLFVDATRKAGHGSSLSHSCDPTCEVRVASVNGVLCLAMTTLRALEMGEELTFDYNAVTESLNEYRSAVCLCGHHRCRGSFLHFATADCYQQVLNRNAPVATRFANLVKGSMKKVMSEDDDRVLRNHGFLTAAFGAISVNRRQDPGCMDCDSLDFVPVWLRTFVADTLRYIEYERRALPISLICDHLASLKDSEEEEVGPELLQREPSKAQPSFFYFTRTQSDFVNSLMKKEGIPDTLIGIQRRQAFNKIAANYWQALPDEKKEYWKQQSTIEFEARLKAWRTANTKSSKSSSAKKQKKGDPKKPAIGDLLLSSKMSFQDADAEGISAMEQRIQQLTQCLSRIGRVLDRHREWSFEHEVVNNSGNCYTAQTLRERVHSPIQIASDDVVVGWIWNAQDGPVTALMAAAESSRWARPNLSEKLVKVRSKYVELVAFGDPTTINPGTIESASGVDAIKARTKLKSALLEIRSILLQELKQMGKLYRQYKSLQRLELEKSNDEDGNEGQSLDEDDTLEDAPQSQGTSELQDCRDVDVAQHDAVGIDDAPATHLYEGFQSSPSLVSEGVNPSTSFTSSPSVDKMLPKDATTDERPSANARSTAIASPPTAQSLVEANPWLEHIHERFVMCAVADLLLLYAHTTNFFLMQPYKALTSTPIEVYARELGNAVPRSAMDVDSEDFAEVSNLASQANEVKDHIGRKGKELNGRSMKGSSPEICEPDDIISNVTVRYNGDYVLSQLLQWYNGGIGQKPGLPDLMGCAVLPSIQGCFASEMLVSSRSKTDKKTTYETKIRSRLLEWLQDPYQRGGPWPDDVRKAFAPSDDNRLKGDTSSQWLPFGSPILDFLVTGDESNIQDALEELDGDRKATTKGKPGSLLLSVDKGRPAQAVSNWVQCENPSCLKWRKIPWHVDIDLLPEKFYCSINKWDPKGNSCDAPEDDWDEDDKLVGGDGKVEGSPVRKDPNAALCPSLEANFFVGARFDVLRGGKVKSTIGTVTKTDFSGKIKRIMFRFYKCRAEADEWIEFGSNRIAPLFSKVPKPTKSTKQANLAVDQLATTNDGTPSTTQPIQGFELDGGSSSIHNGLENHCEAGAAAEANTAKETTPPTAPSRIDSENNTSLLNNVVAYMRNQSVDDHDAAIQPQTEGNERPIVRSADESEAPLLDQRALADQSGQLESKDSGSQKENVGIGNLVEPNVHELATSESMCMDTTDALSAMLSLATSCVPPNVISSDNTINAPPTNGIPDSRHDDDVHPGNGFLNGCNHQRQIEGPVSVSSGPTHFAGSPLDHLALLADASTDLQSRGASTFPDDSNGSQSNNEANHVARELLAFAQPYGNSEWGALLRKQQLQEQQIRDLSTLEAVLYEQRVREQQRRELSALETQLRHDEEQLRARQGGLPGYPDAVPPQQPVTLPMPAASSSGPITAPNGALPTWAASMHPHPAGGVPHSVVSNSATHHHS